MESPSRRVPTNLLLALGAALLALAGVEAALRRVPEPVAPRRARDLRAAGLRELHWFDVMVPNTYGSYKGVPYRVNSAGFRGPDVARTPPAGGFRIVLVGDSVTAGGGLIEGETYAGRAEAALDAIGPGRFEVLNIGLPGPNLQGLLDGRLVPIGLPHHPDMLVYGFTINDVMGPRYQKLPSARPPTPSALRVLGLVQEAWDLAMRRLGSYQNELDLNFFGATGAWVDFDGELARLARFAGERGICALVLIHTHLFRLNWLHPLKRHYAAVEHAAQAHGLHVVQSLPYHLGRADKTLWQGAFDPHPNAEGHRLLAESLLDGLEALPMACWKGNPPAFDRRDGHRGAR